MSLEIDPNKDSSFYIWEPLFKVSISQLHTTSTTYLRMFGSPTTGDPDTDRVLANQDLVTYISIAKMIEHYKKGVAIRVINYNDTKRIYDYIENHIHAWKNNLQNGVNIGGAPIEDLIILDRFASTVYQHAKHLISQEELDSFLVKSMSKIQTINKFNIIKPLEDKVKTVTINASEEPEDKYVPRESLIDIFKNSSVGARKWR